ncbi:MAG: hypothetical protein L6R38_004347 [Xanthoria sp. 2 TBL-2021]|nr:MAG: hypothetical protein L6R38_004347 [Xanthoria sp. 2 TBL-2021]
MKDLSLRRFLVSADGVEPQALGTSGRLCRRKDIKVSWKRMAPLTNDAFGEIADLK